MIEKILIAILTALVTYEYRHLLLKPLTLIILVSGVPLVIWFLLPLL
ncbi:hypothetical protein [Pseudomonas paraeruginosa]